MSVRYTLITDNGNETGTLECETKEHGMFLVHSRVWELERAGVEVLEQRWVILNLDA